jgi:hypothetical protein
MKLWLDDQINDINCPDRHLPDGYIGVNSALKAIKLLKQGNVSFISFDHDLGDNKFSGYIVAKYIEKYAYLGKLNKIGWEIHSANPVGSNNIKQAMQSAERFWNK